MLALSSFPMFTTFCSDCWFIRRMVYSMKAMAWCSPLSEIAVTNIAGAKNLDTTGCPTKIARIVGGGEMPGAPDDDGRARSAGATEDSTGGGASDGENSQTYYFGASTLTLGKIKEMVKKGYFAEGKARAPTAEAVSEPDPDKAIVYENFFIASLCMHLHPALANILLHFQAQLH
jgi:hypothetical protein